jgi:hypothetical protein
VTWQSWEIDRKSDELVGPCGCRVPNNYAGVMAAREHDCSKAGEGK